MTWRWEPLRDLLDNRSKVSQDFKLAFQIYTFQDSAQKTGGRITGHLPVPTRDLTPPDGVVPALTFQSDGLLPYALRGPQRPASPLAALRAAASPNSLPPWHQRHLYCSHIPGYASDQPPWGILLDWAFLHRGLPESYTSGTHWQKPRCRGKLSYAQYDGGFGTKPRFQGLRVSCSVQEGFSLPQVPSTLTTQPPLCTFCSDENVLDSLGAE